ncbi:MAG: ROK family protein, partial [Planctomycetota bacterium]
MEYERPIVSLSEAQSPYFYGVDIGGTNIKIGLVDDRGQTLAFRRISTSEAEGPEQAVERSARTCRELAVEVGIDDAGVPRVGLGA